MVLMVHLSQNSGGAAVRSRWCRLNGGLSGGAGLPWAAADLLSVEESIIRSRACGWIGGDGETSPGTPLFWAERLHKIREITDVSNPFVFFSIKRWWWWCIYNGTWGSI